MTEYILMEDVEYRVVLLLDAGACDYYTYVYIKLIFAEKSIVLFKDNLLALKNIVEHYDKGVCSLDSTLDEEKIGLLLNEYYRCLYEEQTQENIILNNQGQWIGEKYCCFVGLNYATWLYVYAGKVIMKVTPIFDGFEEDDFTKEYSEFVKTYEDIIKKTVSLQQLRKMRQIILKLYYSIFSPKNLLEN